MLRKLLALVFSVFILFLAFVAWKLYPHEDIQKLNAPLAGITSVEGRARLSEVLANSEYQSDYIVLKDTFKPQILASFCGVASSVSVLNASGLDIAQTNFFDVEGAEIKAGIQVALTGMSLSELGSNLGLYGMEVNEVYGNEVSMDSFRGVLKRNLTNPKDFILVNYDRKILDQKGSGHISPVAAYHSGSDSVLVMDTAAHKYEPTWVPVELMYKAIKSVDSSSGKSRGYIEIEQVN